MDYEKLFDLTCSVRTWSGFLLESSTVASNYAAMLVNNIYKNDVLLQFLKNEFYFVEKNMEDLILKYKELENFYNENFKQEV